MNVIHQSKQAKLFGHLQVSTAQLEPSQMSPPNRPEMEYSQHVTDTDFSNKPPNDHQGTGYVCAQEKTSVLLWDIKRFLCKKVCSVWGSVRVLTNPHSYGGTWQDCAHSANNTVTAIKKPTKLKESESRSVMSNSLQPHGLYSPWNSPGQNTGVGSWSLLQGIFPTQGSNLGLPYYRRILYQLSHQGSSRILEWVAYPFSRGSS